MTDHITPEYIWETISKHLSCREKDFWHIVNGPKRETWFVAESIAAFSLNEDENALKGRRIYGEESYGKILGYLNIDKSAFLKSDLRKMPDITMIKGADESLECVIEAKLIQESDFTTIKKTIKNLKKQITLAHKIIADENVAILGLIFVVHDTRFAVSDKNKFDIFAGNPPTDIDTYIDSRKDLSLAEIFVEYMKLHPDLAPEISQNAYCAIEPERFYGDIKGQVEEIFGKKYKWCSMGGADGIQSTCLKEVKPYAGPFISKVSLGIGLIQKKACKK